MQLLDTYFLLFPACARARWTLAISGDGLGYDADVVGDMGGVKRRFIKGAKVGGVVGGVVGLVLWQNVVLHFDGFPGPCFSVVEGWIFTLGTFVAFAVAGGLLWMLFSGLLSWAFGSEATPTTAQLPRTVPTTSRCPKS